jgi:hypothetical protein
MAPKPGNAFAQQKELQRQKDLEIQPPEEHLPSTPMTTMSMFIGSELLQVNHEEPTELGSLTNVDPLHKPATSRGKLGKRAFTDPLGARTAHYTGTTEPSSVGKQASGLGYIKSKFTAMSKKKGTPEQPSHPFTKPAPSESPFNSISSPTMPNSRRIEVPEATRTPRERDPSQPLPGHLSTTTTAQSIATRQSQYSSALKNDAMILGNMSMSPTRSGSYAVTGYPAVVGVSHPSIISMAGSILEVSPPKFDSTNNPYKWPDSSMQLETYDTSYIAPLPPPPGDDFIDQPVFHQQLPFYLQLEPHERTERANFGSQQFSHQHDNLKNRTWKQLHAQYPATMPRFSLLEQKHFYQDNSKSPTTLAQNSNGVVEAHELQKASIATFLNKAHASDTKSESGKEASGALNDTENAADNATSVSGSLRRSASTCELRYSSFRSVSPDRTPVAKKDCNSSIQATKSSQVLSPTAPVFRPAGLQTPTAMTPIVLKPDRYEDERTKQAEVTQNLFRNIGGDISSLQERSTPLHDGRPGQASDSKKKESPSARSLEDGTTGGGYPPTPQHPDYQARSTLEEQMAHHFNVVHHHMDAVKYSLKRCIEVARDHVADKHSSQVDKNFLNQFRQLCIQSNGFRQYLERIEQHTSNLKHGISGEGLRGVSVEMASRLAAQEHRLREEFTRVNKNVLTLNENVYAIQRSLNKQMFQMNQKLDLLLDAQGIDIPYEGQPPRQDRGAMGQKLREEARRRQDEVMDPATMGAHQKDIAAASRASSPTTEISTPPTKNRQPIPLPTKVPIMAAALTSTPPHVPQLPQPQSQSSFATVTITDPSIPSPSAVSNARRIRHGQTRGQGEGRKENRRAGIVVKGLANTNSMHGPANRVHPALRYQEGIERLAAGKEKQQTAGMTAENDNNEVLWRRPSDEGEIGGRWYKAATQQ